ncbi:kinesin-like protein KIF19 [Ochotona princeps]|uniref:kinesin-like protein KIF19 n=1 Tax=Ochotona princeps TaxID=9978 RepID=UPI00271512F2|nr:kinesin-like protein KIF19 [Ochotona princeps]
MRPLSRLICGRSSSIPAHQGTDGGTLPRASTSGRTSCSFADSLTSSTDLPTNATEVPALSLEHETEDFIDDLKQGHPNILVTVRVRPVQPRELQNGSKDVVRVLDNKVVLLLDPGLCSHDDVLRIKRTREKRYAFDYVFDSTKDQQCVYANTTEFLVDGVLRGFNATAFAYGATGAGKTYTMIGSYENPGVMVRTLKDLFVKVDQQSADNEYNIRCSFLEIYNETVRDLLDARNDHCEVREDPTRGMAISNVSEVAVKTAHEILELLQKGNKRRIQEPTDANQTSSRSHAVLQVVVTQKSRIPGVTAELAVGKLSMVDLAGSERASQNNNRGMRMVEGASINRSLLALGNVINALCDRGKTAKNIFVPYRDSKLTRLLKDSLGGSCRTVMIANISPAHTQFEDTNNTLKYANRAKNIKTISKRNVLTVNYHIEKYTHVIEQLQAEVGTLRAMLASGAQASVLQVRFPRGWQLRTSSRLLECTIWRKTISLCTRDARAITVDDSSLLSRRDQLVAGYTFMVVLFNRSSSIAYGVCNCVSDWEARRSSMVAVSTVCTDPGASASTSRVAGIVKTLQERQRLRQALVRLDEQLHQLEQHSPLNSDGATCSLTSQARSLQKVEPLDSQGLVSTLVATPSLYLWWRFGRHIVRYKCTTHRDVDHWTPP